MMRVVTLAFRVADHAFLEAASLLVPARARSEWLREWRSEMWHVRKACTPPSADPARSECAVMAFCLGAFQDAWCLSRDASPHEAPPVPVHGSAGQCLLWMAAVLIAAYAFALCQPEVRMVRNAHRYPVRSGTILLEDQNSGKNAPTVPFQRFRAWSEGHHRYFDGFAFYRIQQQDVSAGAEAPSRWQVAESSSNLFDLLGVPIRFAPDENGAGIHAPIAILSYRVWKSEFGGDPAIVGSVVSIGGQQTRVAGVAPERAWKLPGRPDAWLLEPDAALPAEVKGNVVAHLTRAGRAEMWADRVQITVYNPDHTEQDFLGVAFGGPTPTPSDLYRFAVLLALLALPAVTSVSLGQFSVSSHKPPWPKRILRWAYLGAKLLLLLPIANFAALDVAYCHASQHSAASEYAQLSVCFLICLFGFRWALLDQRQRCPVCLRRVAHPAQVGLASRTFLAWNGTELMCTGGHTLLHVPGLPTSWFAAQRWQYLDSSWDFLFAGPEAG
ncbi:MAG TPA: hypothetical protein VGG26_11175 [Terracidiphilus sp.]|jgi:hypothetical protein